MTNIQINHKKNAIEMTKKFYNEACKFGTDEYKMLQEARRDYPGYEPVVAKSKKGGNGAPDVFRGLNFEYMELYIMKHDDAEQSIMAEFMSLRAKDNESIAMGVESESYLVIRDWFLDQYPDVRKFYEKRGKLVDDVRRKKEEARMAKLEEEQKARREKLLSLIA